MPHSRADVVRTAIEVLDRYGLADLTMRRLGAELAVRPSALYHHVTSKQELLAAVADELLARGRRQRTALAWDDRLREVCVELRESLLAYRDGAELVATVRAFGLGAEEPAAALTAALRDAGASDELATTAARTLLHFVFGHAIDEQTQLQASSAGAIADAPREESDFDLGLALVVDGIQAHLETATATEPRR